MVKVSEYWRQRLNCLLIETDPLKVEKRKREIHNEFFKDVKA